MDCSAQSVSNAYTSPAYTPSTEPVEVNVKTLMDAGAHFGHQTERWNPKMLPFIFGVRNNTHIVNLDLTIKQWERARKFISDVLGRGGSLLMVGTKNQAREIISGEAQRAGAFYVTTRWLGGTLSNFQTIKNSIERMRKLENLLTESEKPDTKVKLVKKEKLTISRELEKLSNSLGGIRTMRRPPDVMFVVDIIKESIAVAEARKLHIPVVALVDTNADPNLVDFPIASNDDASKTIRLFAGAVADAAIEGRQAYEARIPSDQRAGEESQDATNGDGHVADAERGMRAENGASA